MDSIIQIYAIYLLGYFSSDYNVLYLICQRFGINIWQLILFQNHEWRMIRILLAHTFIYAMLFFTTFRLVYHCIYQRRFNPCKTVRFKLLLEHVLTSNFCGYFLASTYRGQPAIPDMMTSQIPQWIFLFMKEDGMDKDEEYQLLRKSLFLEMVLMILKLVATLVLLTYVCNSIICKRCRPDTGCRKKSITLFSWCYEWLHGQ